MSQQPRSGFTYQELLLPFQKFEALLGAKPPKRESFTADLWQWISAWRSIDLAWSPMNDEYRRWLRLGHYKGWFDAHRDTPAQREEAAP